MATLIAFYNSEGCMGRCDAHCYEAKHPQCDCICGGANHGRGLQQAQDNTKQLAQHWVDEWQRRHPGQDFNFDIMQATAQKKLF